MGAGWFLDFLAMVSLSLAIMNLLPIPILDGGHLLYYLIEFVKGSPVSERTQDAGQYVGLMLLVALMGLAFYNDIHRILPSLRAPSGIAVKRPGVDGRANDSRNVRDSTASWW